MTRLRAKAHWRSALIWAAYLRRAKTRFRMDDGRHERKRRLDLPDQALLVGLGISRVGWWLIDVKPRLGMSPSVPVFGRRQRRDCPHAQLAGVQKAPSPCLAPLPQWLEDLRRQHHVPVLAAVRLHDADDHLLTVDPPCQ